MAIRSKTDLDAAASRGKASLYPDKPRIFVGAASCGLAAGADDVIQALNEANSRLGKNYEISRTGCLGFCQVEPLVDVWMPGKYRVVYQTVDPKKATEIMEAAVTGKVLPEYALMKLTGEYDVFHDRRLDYAFSNHVPGLDAIPPLEEVPFYKKQYKIVLRNCGFADPANLDHYIARGGYYPLYATLSGKEPDEVVDIVLKSSLRGRGGAGFVTGTKWKICRDIKSDNKYVVCNASEGDPGAYMDRGVLEGDPQAVVEGMIIGAYAVGNCNEGYVYVSNEYANAKARLIKAIEVARDAGLLGHDIFGSGFDFDIKINRGGGAFVCGEETALIMCLAGQVGEPRQRPPYPVAVGFKDQPTVINNVETWANIPVILNRGAEWFSSMGTQNSKGTKVFSLVGSIKNTGLVEVPMGITLREILFDIGGGVPGDKKFKAVQTGGPLGGTLILDTESIINLPVDFEALADAGSMIGSGGMIVMDEDACMVDLARYFLNFLKWESCGKCVPCREGIRQMLAILERICNGEGKEGDIELLEEMGSIIKKASLCALGQSVPNPVLSTIRYFREEYNAHIRDKKCPAGVCKELINYSITDKCNGCQVCVPVCPTVAIKGVAKRLHHIDDSLCIKCDACYEVCELNAVERR